MTGFDVAAGLEALSRAREADDLIGSSQANSGRYRSLRDRAVAEALAAGLSMEHVADDLGVLISDVERMVSAAEIDVRTDADEDDGHTVSSSARVSDPR